MLVALCVVYTSVALAGESLNQAAYVQGTTNYKFGYHSIPNIPVKGAPKDTDWSRWAMLHDGEFYRFYAFQEGSVTNFYQGAFNRSVEQYQWSYESIPMLTLIGTPNDSNPKSAAMLHDGEDFRFYYQTK
jgi:hypothetical protein